MKHNRKEQLIQVGAEALADALLELAVHDDNAYEVVERLIAPKGQNVVRFQNKLASLRDSRQFYDWRRIGEFTTKLSQLLQDLKAGEDDPAIGLDLVASFYEADGTIFEMCDDSCGSIGDIFREEAKDLFLDYASRATNEVVMNTILRVNRCDDYGIRDSLVYCASQCLPDAALYELVTKFQQQAQSASASDYNRNYALLLIESLARQLKDPELFKNTRITSWGTLSTAAFISIAEVYFDSGDSESALAWLEKIEKGDEFQADKRNALLKAIHKKQGDPEQLAALLRAEFDALPSLETLNALLNVVGFDQKDAILKKTIDDIFQGERFHTWHAEFLITLDRIDLAADYVIKHGNTIDGSYYGGVLSLAKAFAATHPLAASLLYRSLVSSVLERGYTKAYPHGIKYLKRLDSLAKKMVDWQTTPSHENFKEQLFKSYSRKRSFWAKYQG